MPGYGKVEITLSGQTERWRERKMPTVTNLQGGWVVGVAIHDGSSLDTERDEQLD